MNVSTSVEDADDNKVEAYTTIVSVDDVTRPAISAPTYPANGVARFALSEPINANAAAVEAALTIKDSNGVAKSATGLVTDVTANYIDLDISGFTTGENHSVTAIGLKDYAGNLISPNPVTFTVVNNTVDSVDPSVNALSSAKEGQLTITFSEKVKADANGVIGTYDIGAGPVNIDITNGNATVDSTGTVVTVTAVGFTGVKTVTIDGYKDLSGRTGAAFSRVISFVADTTKPTVSSTKVEKINGVEYLVVEFSENVNVQDDVDITGKVVKNFVESPVTLVTDADGIASAGAGEVSVAVAAYKPVSGKSKAVQINLSNLADGAYTVSLPQGFVKDEATLSNDASSTISFTRGSDALKPELTSAGTNGITKVNNTTYTVSFNTALEAASALNTSNYVFEGATVTNAIFTKNDSTGADVKLTFAPGSVTLSGERAVTIKNVKSSAGVAMDTVNTTEVLTENVAPTATAALTATDTITVTFSEAMDPATIVENIASADFDLYIGGTKASYTLLNEAAVANTGDKKFTVKLDNATFSATDLTKEIKLVATAAFDAADANGNVANVTEITVAK